MARYCTCAYVADPPCAYCEQRIEREVDRIEDPDPGLMRELEDRDQVWHERWLDKIGGSL